MNPKSKILVLSDIIFNPIEREISNLNLTYHLSSEYHEDINSALIAIEERQINTFSIIIIHSDQFFHRKPISWQSSILHTIYNFCIRFSSIKILISNCFNTSFELIEERRSLGYCFNTFLTYQEQFENIKKLDNAYFFDFQSILNKIGEQNAYNFELGMLYQMPYTKKLIGQLSIEFVNHINFHLKEEKKAIILDCDNTLWDGIIGEDGFNGIHCDKNAIGLLFYNFQIFIKNLKKDGFLLCLCSKNNENDVKEIFAKKNMPLKWDDFIIKKVNWNEKSQNIHEISQELNIGEDSFIFIDDNLFEINVIKQFTNVDCTFHFKKNYNNFLELTRNYAFRKKQILNDDRNKSAQYEVDQIRKAEERKYKNLDEFIESLSINMEISINDSADIERLSQMTEKTNQFNFNKKAYTIPDLQNWITRSNIIYSLKVSDKFGDYGTVGLILVQIIDHFAIVENYLLSCRVLGKRIENKFFEKVRISLKQQGIEIKTILFKETNKNIPVKNFIEQYNYASIIKKIK